MARTIKMFTREITTTVATAMCVDTTKAEVSNKDFTMTIETDDTAVALKWLKKNVETDTLKIATVISLAQHSKLYGCTIEEFLSVAKELDPQTRKVLEA